jgi:hypothetical protein
MDNIAELGDLPALQELNIAGNPLVAVNQREFLIGLLLFGGIRPAEESMRKILGYSEENRKYKPSAMVIASERHSKLLTAGDETNPHPKPQTPNPKPQTPNPVAGDEKPPHRKPQISYSLSPKTLTRTPSIRLLVSANCCRRNPKPKLQKFHAVFHVSVFRVYEAAACCLAQTAQGWLVTLRSAKPLTCDYA